MGADGSAGLDQELVKTVVMAIGEGFYHLDGAEGDYYPFQLSFKFEYLH